MGGSPMYGRGTRRGILQLLILLCSLAVVQPSRDAELLRGAGDGYGREEKVPMTVVVPDYSPWPAPLAAPAPAPAPAHRPAPAPAPASAPVRAPKPAPAAGSDDDMPRLPSERRSPDGAPSGRNACVLAGARAPAPAASAGTSTDFISSSPAVPLPAGVTDSATVLPMPTPGKQQHQRQDVGMGALLQPRTVQLAIPLAMMLFFWALW